ncbi:natural resistance-associated macrophage protein-domain-containing protein [Chytridium lagenaria]|nr:natural resistance-associated macrophage protein-domain-containing protein [Chytridium lagenaria]
MNNPESSSSSSSSSSTHPSTSRDPGPSIRPSSTPSPIIHRSLHHRRSLPPTSRSISPHRPTDAQEVYSTLSCKTPTTQLISSNSPITPLQAIYEAFIPPSTPPSPRSRFTYDPRTPLLTQEPDTYGAVKGLTEESDVESDVLVANVMGRPEPRARVHWIKTFFKFVGPGFMIGYLDPGNWSVDLSAGSQFGYSLLHVIFLANIMAIVLQYLCIKLGVVTGLDLAMSCRRILPRPINLLFYLLCEIAIIATDLAEVIGTAVALRLLFNIPLTVGVAVTALDVLVILAVWGAKNLRVFEGLLWCWWRLWRGVLRFLIWKSGPVWGDVGWGMVPTTRLFTEDGMLYLAMGIIGATIMPHNLYIHSSIVRYRSSKDSTILGDIHDVPTDDTPHLHTAQPTRRQQLIPQILWYTNLDSILALTCALLINASILIVSSSSFHDPTHPSEIAELDDAYTLLRENLGPPAGVAFAAALLFAGQSSTVTGTIAGQIVMEGFLKPSIKIPPWVRRLSTRCLAIVPAMGGMNRLLVASQVVLSLQLPFAIWPLVFMSVRFKDEDSGCTTPTPPPTTSPTTTLPPPPGTSDVDNASSNEILACYANEWPLFIVSVVVAVVITAFNVVLLVQIFS